METDLPNLIGKRLSHFTIVDRLGSGAMGEVYLAHDDELGREVALKVLPQDFASDDKRLARFQREAKLASQLSHANIATIHEAGSSDGTHFIAMEVVRGETLATLVRPGGLSLEPILDVAIPIAAGLREAHSAGVLHRDLKPGNVMVTERGRVKIIDFGLSCSSEESDFTPGLTSSDNALGTPHYMSPEQMRGAALDERSDLFSLGVILYELGTGVRPFAGNSLGALAKALLTEEPPPLIQVNPHLGTLFTHVVDRLLQKDPDQRYQTSADLLAELRSLKETVARSGEGRKSTRAARTRAALLGLGAGLLVIATFLAARSAFQTSAHVEREQMIVVLPFNNLGASEDEYFAAGMTEEITSRLAAASGLGVISGKWLLRYADSGKTTREIGDELGVGYILSGSVRWDSGGEAPNRVRITPELIRARDGRQLWSEPYDRIIEDIFEVQSDIASQVISRLGVALPQAVGAAVAADPTENMEAYRLYLKARGFWYKRTEANVQRALEYLQQAVALDTNYALAHAGIADVWIFRGWYSVLAPKETFPRAKAAVLEALRINENLAQAHASLAHIHFEFDHDWDAARQEYERAIALDPRYALAHHWYGGFLSAMGENERALEQAQAARQLDPYASIVVTWVGLRHYFARRYDAAIETYLEALELGADFAPLHWHLGWAYEQTEQPVKALAAARKAIAISDGNPLYIAALGHALAKAGKQTEARAVLEQLRQQAATRHVSAYHVAVIHAALGDTDAAFERLDEALAERSPWIGYLRVDPRVDPLRSDARFDALLGKARLELAE
jgi:TolB-like protein/Tfp pilus assembly protein PilF/predicted Ser/Thr protein kinase